MPLNGKMTGNMFTPIVTNNNAFNVKIVSPDGSMEEKPNAKLDAQSETKIKVGDMLAGEVAGSDKKEIGKVVAVQVESGEVVGYKILTDDGNEVILDPSTVTKHDQNNGSEVGKNIIRKNESMSFKSSFIPSFSDYVKGLGS